MPTFQRRPNDGHDTQVEGSRALSMRWLAHEINSLLDGSMRSIRLAERILRESEETYATDALARLGRGLEAMDRMAAVLDRAMADPGIQRVFWSERSLAAEIDHVLDLVRPIAEPLGVELAKSIDEMAATVDAGPLGVVLGNGLRNAIEACAQVDGPRRVGLDVVVSSGEIRIVIEDCGQGVFGMPVEGTTTREDGHGLGLAVSRAIVAALGGRMLLSSVPFAGGALLEVVVPRDGIDHER